MRVLKSIRLVGVPWFKDQSFDLSRNGLSVILGKNCNTPSNSTNAAGKSFFFSHLPEVLLDEVPGDNRKDRTRKGKAEVVLSVGGHDYRIVKDFAKPSNSRIEKDGVDLGIKDVAERKAYIQKLIGKTPVEYQTLDFIDSTNIRNHPLIKGDTASRRNYFTEFFKLDSVDSFRKLVRDAISSLNEKAAILQELKSQHSSLSKDLVEDISQVEEKLSAAAIKKAKLSKDLEILDSVAQYAAYCTANNYELELCKKHKAKLHSGVFEDRLAVEKDRLRTAKANEDYASDLRAWKLSVQKRNTYLESHPDLKDIDLQDVKRDLRKAESRLDEMNQRNSDAARKADAHESKIETVAKAIQTVNKQIEALDKDETCSKCGQPLSKAHRAAERKNLKLELTKLEHDKNKLEKAELPALQDTTVIKQKIDKLRKHHESILRIPVVEDKPSRPDVDINEDVDTIRERISKISRILDAYQQVSANKKFYRRFLSNERPESDVTKRQSLLLDQYDSVSKTIAELEFRIATHNKVEQRINDICDRIKSYENDLADLEVLKILERAYAAGTGGVKEIAIKAICDRLTATTNQYAKLIFPEDYTFSFDLDTQFHILVTRKYKGDSVTSDVRKLSGAESSMFSLLLLIVLLSFIPKANRSNVLVLDEPNANFGQEMTDALIRFLPVLNKVIPHIIVITPHSEHDYGPKAEYFTVVKKGNASKIVKGK